ncbi:MAG: aminopeptidase [Gammaproteobacteria bacterium]
MVGITGCSAGYYLQAAAGQVALMRSRVPLEQVLADPHTLAETRRQLLVADNALLFARLQLGLPASRSYHAYAALDRPAVVWNVFAAPEFSLKPVEWCYPVAGCAAYRGWFSERKARRFAEGLAEQGNDVFVGGVAAYSTLGWFADPILSTMLGGSDTDLVGILFHELAHEKVFLPGDTRFNEGFATFVQIEGTERWLAARGDTVALCGFRRQQHRRSQALTILPALRQTLAKVYAAPGITTAERRTARQAAFAESRARYASLRADWPLPTATEATPPPATPKMHCGSMAGLMHV